MTSLNQSCWKRIPKSDSIISLYYSYDGESAMNHAILIINRMKVSTSPCGTGNMTLPLLTAALSAQLYFQASLLQGKEPSVPAG